MTATLVGSRTTLPIPSIYDSANAASWSYNPDQQVIFEKAIEWQQRHSIRPSASDTKKVHLLLIDLQKDFCFPPPDGSLYVGGRSGRGAIEDNDRISQFIYRNLSSISEITCTLDSHFPFQIFFPSFWLGADDKPPAPHTIIKLEDIKAGRYRPNPAIASWLCNGNYLWLQRQVEFYCSELEKGRDSDPNAEQHKGKYELYLWPSHCILGSAGHALAGVIHEARLFHSYARNSKGLVEVKGGNFLTENYSVLSPEVLLRFDGNPLAQKNTQFINTLLNSDVVIIAGQAASHCVKSSIEDLLGEIRMKDEKLVRKVYILKDCMSSVAVPDPARPGSFLADFTPEAERSLKLFEDAGMHVVESTTPIEQWPEFSL